MQTAVVVCIFNRPDQVELAMRQVATAKPEKLFIIAEGPRPSHREDVENCLAARSTAERLVEWNCQIFRDYSASHLGTAQRVITGLSYAFEWVEQAIVLEVGVVPEQTFFRFCDELLARYRHDERVMHINGIAQDEQWPVNRESYRFTRFIHGNGWATWRRAWKHFDFSTSLWPWVRTLGWLERVVENNPAALRYYHDKFQQAYDHPYNPPTLPYWQPQWSFACWTNSGLGITPACNMISHTASESNSASSQDGAPARAMSFPLIHPVSVRPDYDRDSLYFHNALLPEITAEQGTISVRSTILSTTLRCVQQLLRRPVGKAAFTSVQPGRPKPAT